MVDDDLVRFARKLLRAMDESAASIEGAVIGGSYSTLEAYREAVGEIRAIKRLRAQAIELLDADTRRSLTSRH